MLSIIEKYVNNREISDTDTNYYKTYRKIYDRYNLILSRYINNSAPSENDLKHFKSMLDSMNIKSSHKFFNKGPELEIFTIRLDEELGISYDEQQENIFNINKYNVEKIIDENGLTDIKLSTIKNTITCEETVDTDNTNKFIVRIINRDGNASAIWFIKHMYSIEFYDSIDCCTLAFKNFKNGRRFGQWNSEVEDLALRIYVAYMNRNKTEDKCEYQSGLEDKADEVKKENKTITVINKTRDRLDDIIDFELIRYKKYFPKKVIDIIHRETRKLLLISDYMLEAKRLTKVHNKKTENTLRMIMPGAVRDSIIYVANEFGDRGNAKAREILIRTLNKVETEQKKKEARLKADAIREAQLQCENQPLAIKDIEEENKIKEADQFWGTYSDSIKEYRDNVTNNDISISEDKLSIIEGNKRISKLYHMTLESTVAKSLGIDSKQKASKLKREYAKVVKEADEKIDKQKIARLIAEVKKDELEEYIRSCIVDSFLILMDRKKLDTAVLDGNTITFLREEAKKRGHINWNPNSGVSVERNEHTERGTLTVYGGTIIDGGNNNENQASLQIKLTDEALTDLCMLIGTQSPTSSQLNKFIEIEVLYNKSQRPDVFSIIPEAIEAYLTNRNKSDFSLLKQLDSSRKDVKIYIPCEYYAYIKAVFAQNQDNKLLKRNYTAVLNILIYDYLIRATGKDYRIL